MQYPSMSPFDSKFMQTSCDMGGRYVSRDGGDSWRLIPFWEVSGHTGKAVFDRKNTYVRGRGGIFVSPDKRDTWKKVTEGLPWDTRERMTLMETVGKNRQALAVGTPSGLWLSADAAGTWKLSRKGKCTDLVFLGDTLFLSGDKNLLMSKDLGKTWEDTTPEQAQGKQVVSIAAGQEKDEMILLAFLEDRKTLLASTDWGKTWESRQVAGENARRGSILGMAPNQTEIVFLTRPYELWRSEDSGKTWARCCYARNGIAPGLRESEFLGRHKWGLGQIHFAIDPTDTNRVIVTSMSDLFYSGDAGKIWKQVLDVDTVNSLPNTSKGILHIYSVDIHPTKPNIIYACTGTHGVWCSQDEGRTWESMKGVPHFRTTHVTVDPDDPETIYVTTFGGGTWKWYYLPGGRKRKRSKPAARRQP